MYIKDYSDKTSYYRYFYNYKRILRLIGWILRFKYNSSQPKEQRKGELASQEFHHAEMKLSWTIQKEFFCTENYESLKSLEIFTRWQSSNMCKNENYLSKDEKIFSPK